MVKPNWYPNDQQLRQFSLASILGFALVGVVLYRAWGLSLQTACVVAGLGLGWSVIGLIKPAVARMLYLPLMFLTLPIGWVISNLLLRVIFYGVLTPLGLIFRLMKRDPLALMRPAETTYWQKHEQITDPTRYYQQS